MNANGSQQGQELNPIEAAQYALMFLMRADLKPHERLQFAKAEVLLQAIATGQVGIVPGAPPREPEPPRQELAS